MRKKESRTKRRKIHLVVSDEEVHAEPPKAAGHPEAAGAFPGSYPKSGNVAHGDEEKTRNTGEATIREADQRLEQKGGAK